MTRFWIGFLCAVLLSNCFPGRLHADDYARFKKMNEVSREMAKERNQEIVFYGKVVDLDESPVAGAHVKMSVRIFGAMPPKSSFDKFEAVTDAEGCYKIVGLGELIGLEDIAKEGYQYSVDYNPKRSLWSTKPHKRKGIGYEPDKPMIFKLRKKDEPAFLIGGSKRVQLSPGDWESLDLYLMVWAEPYEDIVNKMMYPDWHADIKLSVEEDGDNFKFIIESLDPDSGLVQVKAKYKETLTQAPLHGYKKKLVIPVKKKSSGHLYAFVKNEGGLFYSRLDFRYMHQKDHNFVFFESSYLSNMAGEKGFEFSSELAKLHRNNQKEKHHSRLKREQLRNGTIILPVLEEAQ